mmetsp:Transcript_3825/g.5229  ORF Transcript_3825/g.5229 Transcript_3825/m.5229 type:complete len:112 (-) Transcript_3825:205-540(-)
MAILLNGAQSSVIVKEIIPIISAIVQNEPARKKNTTGKETWSQYTKGAHRPEPFGWPLKGRTRNFARVVISTVAEEVESFVRLIVPDNMEHTINDPPEQTGAPNLVYAPRA